jgi:acyl-CoA reductase-like NAD-dependent aldehyde dehydrogenase
MTIKSQMFIAGEYCDASDGRTFEVVCPATNEILAHVASGTAEDVDRAVRAATQAFENPSWRKIEVRHRVELLQKVGNLILEHQEELARLEALDTGNPISDVREYFIPGAAGCFEFFPTLSYHLTGQQIPISSQLFDYTLYEPLGVVAVIVPWNGPLEISCARLASALAVGNTCVLKPSPLAPLTCLRLGKIFLEAGFPPGVVNIIAGTDDDVGAALIHHPQVQMISFTGSVRTGQIVHGAAAKTTKRVSLELGGKSPNIVFPDADLSKAVPGAAQAIYQMSGQNCVAGSRLILHESIHDEFVSRLIDESNRYRVGDVLDPQTTMGPLISSSHLTKVKQYVTSGLEEGAKLVLGGSGPSDPHLKRGNYFLPTIFTEVSSWMKIAREEIFGPVLCVFKFSSTEEAVSMANGSHYGLGAGIWTQDLNRAHRLAGLLEAGTVYINTYNEFYNQIPFGGYKQSGIGYEYGLDALKQYVQRKNVLIRLD